MSKLYNVAIDEPHGDSNPDHHDRDAIYLSYLDEQDIQRLMAETGGRVSLWPAGLITVNDLIAVVRDEGEGEP
jgi:hypothetical protein